MIALEAAAAALCGDLVTAWLAEDAADALASGGVASLAAKCAAGVAADAEDAAVCGGLAAGAAEAMTGALADPEKTNHPTKGKTIASASAPAAIVTRRLCHSRGPMIFGTAALLIKKRERCIPRSTEAVVRNKRTTVSAGTSASAATSRSGNSAPPMPSKLPW